MKITLTGTVTRVNVPVETSKSSVMEIILSKKYYDSSTGELRAEDHYPVQIWKEKLPDFQKVYNESTSMKITGFINGRMVGENDNVKAFLNFTAQS